MPVVRKKGALFAVYHDSPPPPPPAVASASSSAASKPHPHIGKKDVLSSRSPTQRQKTKSVSTCRAPGTGSLKPRQAALVASSALQSLTGTTGSLGGRGKSLGVLSAKTGNTTAAARGGGGLRDPLAVKNGVGKEKENLRSLGMMGMSSLSAGGKMTEKMHVFVDPGEQKSAGDVGNKDTRPRTGRVLRDKAISEIRARPHHHHLRQRSSSSIHAIQHPVSTSTVFNETSAPTTGQENTTPAGETQATAGLQKPSRPTPHRAITTTSTNDRTTLTSAPRRMSTRSARHEPHDSAMEEDAADAPPVEEDPEESPYLSKPRLRKLKPPSSLLPSPNQQRKMKKVMMMMRESTTTTTTEPDVMESMQNQAGSISPQMTHVQVVSSQPQAQPQAQPQSEAQEQENLFSSSPLIERPRTRKPTTTTTTTAAATITSSSSSHPKSHHHPTKKNPSAGAAAGTYAVVHADQVLCDVSEAYGADTSLQPYGFQRQSDVNPTRAGTMYRMRERTARNGKERTGGKVGGLEPSTYGWAQISRNEFRAPSPPTSSMQRRRAGML